jgi:5-deoxy-glucuronate isomerase
MSGALLRSGTYDAITPESAGWGFSGLRILELAACREHAFDSGDDELVVLPLAGACSVTLDGERFELEGREDVFSAVSDCVYAPRDTRVEIASEAGGRFALATARAGRRHEPQYLPAADVRSELHGGGPASRQINTYCAPDTLDAHRLFVVEVLTPGGNWSSFPPHKHDEHTEDEVPLEEIYYFRIRGQAGFGLHRTYTSDGAIDETVTVRDGDVFLIPRGYHGPCVAAPGHTMYYLNVMAGPAERAWRVCLDPAHEWLGEMLGSLAPDPRCPLTTADGPREAERS